MPILALGVSHRRAPIELLERLAFGTEEFPKAYHQLRQTEGVRGAVIVSTCNRVEVFADVDAYHAGFQAVKAFLSESRDIAPEEFAEPLYSHYEEQAVAHLFTVAAGLDSMVLGEPQILSQVRQAYKTAEAEDATGPVLQGLLRRAIRTGRRARGETAIGASPAAFVEAGAVLAERAQGDLAGKRLAVVGAGLMSDLAVRHMAQRGVGEVLVLARAPERAERLARRAGGEGWPLERLGEALAWADLVVSATGATGTVIGLADAERAGTLREGRPLFLVDLAVPRDVEPAVASLSWVDLANVDDLRSLVGRVDDPAVERVKAIVAEEVERFVAWRRALRVAPLIQGIYDRGERVRQAELDRARARLASFNEEQREAVDAVTRALVAKLLHRPVVVAKDFAEADDRTLRLLAALFDLDPPLA